MQYFEFIDTVNIDSVQKEIEQNAYMWHEQSSRQTNLFVQHQTLNVILVSSDSKETYIPVTRALTPLYQTTYNYVQTLAATISGELSNILIIMLTPFSMVYPHFDKGTYYEQRDRYHIVVKSDGGSLLRSGNETVTMKQGEVWWLDNRQLHESFNMTPHQRIHIVFDMFPRTH